MNRLSCLEIFGDVEYAFRRPVRDENVDFARDRLPDGFEFGSWFHVRPIEEQRSVRRAENTQASPFRFLVNQKGHVRKVGCCNQALFDSRGVVAGHEDFGGDVEPSEPSKERAGFGFVKPSVTGFRFIATVDYCINILWNFQRLIVGCAYRRLATASCLFHGCSVSKRVENRFYSEHSRCSS